MYEDILLRISMRLSVLQFKIAAAVGVPLSIPAFLIGGIVYDPELRDDINKKYPEIGEPRGKTFESHIEAEICILLSQ
jgi:hypothetical protein